MAVSPCDAPVQRAQAVLRAACCSGVILRLQAGDTRRVRC
jgi:hypothetical protein